MACNNIHPVHCGDIFADLALPVLHRAGALQAQRAFVFCMSHIAEMKVAVKALKDQIQAISESEIASSLVEGQFHVRFRHTFLVVQTVT